MANQEDIDKILGQTHVGLLQVEITDPQGLKVGTRSVLSKKNEGTALRNLAEAARTFAGYDCGHGEPLTNIPTDWMKAEYDPQKRMLRVQMAPVQ